ncbi:FAD-dependent oxidoreductase [Acidiferrobacter sp.]|uniref:FAD-dependent oxidoreductase n=1 Tax=Acidiferrobacter sp. TaxID=1872107 RepID=UPI002639E6D4|nr:FAD-dependent oxidoreductase [Acidiferrobacter sp.]
MAEPFLIKMPQLSDTMSEGTIVSWEKAIGDFISRGTVVATVETDKAIMDVEVFREGYLSGPLAAAGSVVPVGAPIAALVAEPAAVGGETATKAQAAPAQAPLAAEPPDGQAVLMPQLSDTMSEGTIVSWEKAIGDFISRGTVVATVETDKAIMDVEVFREGYLSGPRADAGQVVTVGRPIAFLVADAGAVRHGVLAAAPPATPAPPAVPKPVPAGSAQPKTRAPAMPQGATPAPRPHKGTATPYARQLAGAHGIDINSLPGTGPGGCITGTDVIGAGGGPRVQAKRIFQVPGAGRPMDSMEKAVSQNMEYSLSMPLFRVTVYIDPSRLSRAAKDLKASLTVLLAVTAARAIERHPRINSVYQHEDRIVERRQIDIGLAVETEGMGLVVPVLRNVLNRAIGDLNAQWKDLVARARMKRLKPEEYSNPTFTISNMGMLGVAQFDAIPVPGTSAIFAIASTQPQGMPVTITADHRIVNGAEAAKFLNTFKALVEDPQWLAATAAGAARSPSSAQTTRLADPAGAGVLPVDTSGYDCDVLVIGGGPGGEDCARELADHGRRVIMVNDAPLPGGECLWRGCIPSKSWRAAADRIRDRRHDADLGVLNTAEPALDWGRLDAMRRRVLTTRGEMALKTDKGVRIDVREGYAYFDSDHSAVIAPADAGSPYERRAPKPGAAGTRVTFASAVIATGAPPFVPPIPGADGKAVLTSDTVWNLDTPPKRLVIVGAGAIGLEMAQIFADFGSAVTVLEARDRVLPEVEDEVATQLAALLAREERLMVITSAAVRGIDGSPGAVTVRYEAGGTAHTVDADYVLLATGKRPVTAPLALERAGVATDRGAIAVNARAQTNVPHIYAVGDVVGGYMLAHTAGHQGRVAAQTLLCHEAAYDERKDCGVIFTRPQAAFVGLSAAQARAQGHDPAEIKVPFSVDAKAMITGETAGFIKLVADKATRRILGVHFLADHADTLIGAAVLMVSAELTLDQVGSAIHPHPTQTELFGDLARRLLARLRRTARVSG